MTFPTILKLLELGMPLAGLVVVAWAFWRERKRNIELSDKLLELATAQIEATTRHTGAIEANTKVIDRIISKE